MATNPHAANSTGRLFVPHIHVTEPLSAASSIHDIAFGIHNAQHGTDGLQQQTHSYGLLESLAIAYFFPRVKVG
jgi:hypothetical protein